MFGKGTLLFSLLPALMVVPMGSEAQTLTPLQYRVTQKDGTEPPFDNAYYWNNQERGIYVDVVSGEPLFNSLDKYDSGTGWPSFTKPLVPENMVENEDRLLHEFSGPSFCS